MSQVPIPMFTTILTLGYPAGQPHLQQHATEEEYGNRREAGMDDTGLVGFILGDLLQEQEELLHSYIVSDVPMGGAMVPPTPSAPYAPWDWGSTSSASAAATEQIDLDFEFARILQQQINEDHQDLEAADNQGTVEEAQDNNTGVPHRGLSDRLIGYLRQRKYNAWAKFFSWKKVHVDTCTICLEVFQHKEMQIRLPCHHVYHSHCIRRWLKIDKHCPLCKDVVFG